MNASPGGKMLHILLAESMEHFYMNLFLHGLNYLNKRESVPAYSSKCFEHTHLKGIIFYDILLPYC